jgi:hypothetical protein
VNRNTMFLHSTPNLVVLNAINSKQKRITIQLTNDAKMYFWSFS